MPDLIVINTQTATAQRAVVSIPDLVGIGTEIAKKKFQVDGYRYPPSWVSIPTQFHAANFIFYLQILTHNQKKTINTKNHTQSTHKHIKREERSLPQGF